jgi:hypothetical protein
LGTNFLIKTIQIHLTDMKKVLYALITIIGFGNATMAQVPSYVQV